MELTAICTAHESTARAAASQYGAPKWYAGADDLVADPDIDLITIAVRPRHHRELAEAALESNKMVYCEWPLARTSEEALRMVELAERSGVANAVGLQGRFAPAITTMRRTIKDGLIGKPLSFEAQLLQAPFTVDSDRAWLTRIDEASGALHVATAHVTDAVQYVLGDLTDFAAIVETTLPVGRFGDTGEVFEWQTPDTVLYLARAESDVPGVVQVSNATAPSLGYLFRVTGDEGQILARAPEYFQFSPIELSVGRVGDSFEPIRVIGSSDREVELDPATNVGRALESFVDSVLSQSTFRPDFNDGLALHHVIDQIATSVAS